MRFPQIFSRRSNHTPHPRGDYPQPSLKDLILFVTDRCNMRCDHCMFWQRIDDPGPEFTLSDLEKIARSTPPLRTLSLTGGEPFLRNDIADILNTFYSINDTHHIQVNTNGLLRDRMEKLILKDLALKNQHFLTYQVSLDGLADTHDHLRRMPGSFNKICENIKWLKELQSEHPFFRVVVLTNVNKGNYHQLEELSDYLWNEVGVEHTFDLVRGVSFSAWGVPEDILVHEDPRDCDLPPLDKLDEIHETISRINAREGNIFDQCVRQVGIQIQMYKNQEPPVRCISAGRTAGVIYSEGAVAACEFTKPFADLYDYDCDLGALWRSHEAELRRSQITGCTCAHSCFVLTSLQEWEEQQAQQQLVNT